MPKVLKDPMDRKIAVSIKTKFQVASTGAGYKDLNVWLDHVLEHDTQTTNALNLVNAFIASKHLENELEAYARDKPPVAQ